MNITARQVLAVIAIVLVMLSFVGAGVPYALPIAVVLVALGLLL